MHPTASTLARSSTRVHQTRPSLHYGERNTLRLRISGRWLGGRCRRPHAANGLGPCPRAPTRKARVPPGRRVPKRCLRRIRNRSRKGDSTSCTLFQVAPPNAPRRSRPRLDVLRNTGCVVSSTVEAWCRFKYERAIGYDYISLAPGRDSARAVLGTLYVSPTPSMSSRTPWATHVR